MQKSKIISAAVVLLSFIIGIYLYPQMPQVLASHWNAEGNADGYMSKFWGLFLIPIISLGIFLLLIFIPRIDPLRKNISKFTKYYDIFVLVFVGFMFYLYLLTIFWNLNFRFNMTLLLIPSFSLLFYYMGVLVENTKRNWFIGIRTPWTLSSDEVWNKTHSLGGKLFKLAGIIALIGIFFQKYAIWFIIVPVIIFSIYIVVYSYIIYKRN
jgi:uncharacterized membrane protein